MRLEVIEPEFVELVPPDLAPGILYVSMDYATTVHLCACGCGNKVVLPLSPAQWKLYFDGDAIALTPSVGNWQFPCRSHYWIRHNRIVWATRWSAQQIEKSYGSDAADIDSYFSDRRAVAIEPEQLPVQTQPASGFRQWLKRWFGL